MDGRGGRSRRAGIKVATCVAVAIALVVAGCGAGSGARSPSPTPPPGASGFDDYATAWCAAWGTLFRVVGNPDTAGWTDDVHRLQDAADAHDAATAGTLQGRINGELERAREQIAYAAAWPPARRTMIQVDRFFVATETWITAYADLAEGVPGAPDPQAAFEAAGGLDAWRQMSVGAPDIAPYRHGNVRCPDVPMSP